MELMEEGDLMDRVPILLQRDMQYYQKHQTVLQETICAGIVGGKLDFPRYASFAAVKIVLWWEDEYYAAYKKNSGLLHMDELNDDADDDDDCANINGDPGASSAAKLIVKTSDPEKFVGCIVKSADKLLEHIHTLSQEALDHADLTVLTATIGAAALIKNTLWVYLNSVTQNLCPPKGDEPGGSIKLSHQQFAEMTEALAERLLDLHCRLLSLYILQDADSLNWTATQAFFESERGSYTVQMWWLYMQGTRDSLWNSVPPTMAQRVLAGMLNETLSILTVRYTQTVPSAERAPLLLSDVCNLLLCVAELLAAVCDDAGAYVGVKRDGAQSKIVRDVHAKCQELFTCLLLRGVRLGTLYKTVQKGCASWRLLESGGGQPSPWLMFALPTYFPEDPMARAGLGAGSAAVALELRILLSSPQANWSLLMRILLMRNATLSRIILRQLIDKVPPGDCFVSTLEQPLLRHKRTVEKCGGFLCSKECNKLAEWIGQQSDAIGQSNYQTVLALCHVIILTGRAVDLTNTLIAALERSTDSTAQFSCLDRRQVWIQKRPPWLEAILYLIYPILDPIVHMLVTAVQTSNATMYQSMALAISCLTEMCDCLPDCLSSVCAALADILPTDVRPLGGAVLVQVLFAALYTKLMEAIRCEAAEQRARGASSGEETSRSSVCNVLAEAICSIDEDDKHTEAIDGLIRSVYESSQRAGSSMTSNDEDDGDEDGGNVNDGEEDDGDDAGLSFVSTVRLDSICTTAAASTASAQHEHQPRQQSAEYNVDSADYVGELLASDVLASLVGKQCLKILYAYLRNNADWLQQQLGVSVAEASPLQPMPGQRIDERSVDLLSRMFHIGGLQQPFDQLLTSSMRIDYARWLQTPMSMTRERVWLQITKRPEFQDGVRLSVQETVMVAAVTAKCKK